LTWNSRWISGLAGRGAAVVGGRVADLAIELAERRADRPQRRRGGVRGRDPGDLGELGDHVVDRLGAGDRRRQIRDQDLAVDQLADERVGLVARHLGIGVAQRDRQLGRQGAVPRARQRGDQVVRRLDADQRVAPALALAPHRVAQPAGDLAQARVGPVAQALAHGGVGGERVGEVGQVVAVDPRVAAIARARRELEVGGLGQRADGVAGEQAERRRARRHPRHVAHQAALGLLRALAARVGDPRVDAGLEAGRRDEDRLADLRPQHHAGEPGAQERAVGVDRRGELVRGVPGRRDREAFAPPIELVARQEGGPQHERSRRPELRRYRRALARFRHDRLTLAEPRPGAGVTAETHRGRC
jgi:hypothetical protein